MDGLQICVTVRKKLDQWQKTLQNLHKMAQRKLTECLFNQLLLWVHYLMDMAVRNTVTIKSLTPCITEQNAFASVLFRPVCQYVLHEVLIQSRLIMITIRNILMSSSWHQKTVKNLTEARLTSKPAGTGTCRLLWSMRLFWALGSTEFKLTTIQLLIQQVFFQWLVSVTSTLSLQLEKHEEFLHNFNIQGQKRT